MTLTPEEYINLRTDIAELRGIVTGSLGGVQKAQAEINVAIERVHTEFDMVHKRYNELDRKVVAQGTRLDNIEARDSTSRATWAIWISAVGVLLALASKISWA